MQLHRVLSCSAAHELGINVQYVMTLLPTTVLLAGLVQDQWWKVERKPLPVHLRRIKKDDFTCVRHTQTRATKLSTLSTRDVACQPTAPPSGKIVYLRHFFCKGEGKPHLIL